MFSQRFNYNVCYDHHIVNVIGLFQFYHKKVFFTVVNMFFNNLHTSFDQHTVFIYFCLYRGIILVQIIMLNSAGRLGGFYCHLLTNNYLNRINNYNPFLSNPEQKKFTLLTVTWIKLWEILCESLSNSIVKPKLSISYQCDSNSRLVLVSVVVDIGPTKQFCWCYIGPTQWCYLERVMQLHYRVQAQRLYHKFNPV